MTTITSFRSLRRAAAGLLAVTAALGLAPAADAQFGEAAGIAESMQPEYLSRDMVLFADGLQLDDSQRLVLEALFDDYQDSFDEGFARMRQKFEEMRPQLVEGDETRIMRMVFSPFEEWIGEKAELGAQFRGNLQAVLNEQQMAMWPAFERRMRREKSLHKGRLSGESLNLFHVLREMDIHQEIRRQIQSVLDEYDLALDDALLRREQTRRTMQSEVLQALQEQDGDRSLELVDRQLRLSIAVRDVNDQFIETIASALPASESEEFRGAALSKAYPRVYRPSSVERMYDAAIEIQELDADMRETMSDLLETYLVELDGVNVELVEMIKRDEPEKQRHRAKAFAARLRGTTLPKPEDRTRTGFKRKEQIGNYYIQAIRDMLTPEQFAALPGGSRYIEKELRQQRAKTNPARIRQRPAVSKPGSSASNAGSSKGGDLIVDDDESNR